MQLAGQPIIVHTVPALPDRQYALATALRWTTLVHMTGSSDAAHTLAAEWDQRYADLAAHLPLLEPNAVLLTEVGAIRPGRALDVGCGAGAEAIWLAQHGWQVSALDVSQVALDHAGVRAQAAGVQVNWVQGQLQDTPLDRHGFDLVTAFYPALLHSRGQRAEQALLAAVAEGGTLLVVHHADVDVEKAKSHGFDPAHYLGHDDVAALLGDDWAVRIDRRRPRVKPAGIEGQHTHDDVLRARRLR